MIFNGKELKAAVHEAAGIKNARIAYDAERRCVIISGDSLCIEIGGVAAEEDSWGGTPESFVVPKLAAKYIEALTDGDIAIKVDGDKPREGRQSQGSSERMPGMGPGMEASGGHDGCMHSMNGEAGHANREGRQSQGSSERRQGGDPAASERQSFGLHAEQERRSRACELLRIRQGSGKAAFEREIVEPAQMAPVDGDDSILIPSGTLRAMVGAVKHAVAAITEQRVALTGIRLFTSPDGLTMEACDGVRLARAQSPATWTKDIDCVVPADALMKAASMADDGDMAIRADGRRIELTKPGVWSLRTMLIAAAPIDFTKAFEAVGGIEPIRVEAREMAAVLNRCELAIGLSKLFVVVRVAGDGLTIEKKGAFSMFSEAVSGVEAGKAEEGSYAYNAAHLMTAVAAVKDAQAGFVFSPKTKMLCVQADMEDVRYRAIVMPVRVEGVA